MSISKASLLKTGKYEFYITGIITTDREGSPLKMRDGNSYKKFKLAVINRESYTQPVYDPLFGEDDEKVEQIIKSIGSESLFHRFKSGHLELKDLVGTGGYCIIGVREGRDGYDDQNNIECYLQKDYGAFAHLGQADKREKEESVMPSTSEPLSTPTPVPTDPDFDDDIPF